MNISKQWKSPGKKQRKLPVTAAGGRTRRQVTQRRREELKPRLHQATRCRQHTSEFGHIQDWSSAIRLHINISKTKEMIIFRPGTRVKIPPQEIVGIKLIAHM